MLIRSSLLAGACFAALTAGAHADDDLPEADEDMDVVTVYGTSNPLPVFDYPGMVSVVTREDIQKLGASSISDLLEDTPGMQWFGGPRRTGEGPAIRGLSGGNVLILLDGARQTFRSGHDGRFFLDPALVKTAEVVRGPASSLYGSGAVGGVLAFETLDAEDLLEDGETYGFRARTGYRDVNEEWLAGATVFGQTGPVDVLASLAYRDSGDISLGSGDTLPSDDDIWTGLLKGNVDVTEALNLELSWQSFKNDAFEPNNGQGLNEVDPTDVQFANVEKEITSDTLRGRLSFDPATPLINASATLYRSESGVDEYDPQTGRTTERDVETTGFRASNAATFEFGANEIRVTTGVDWFEDKQTGRDSDSTNGVRAGVPDGKSEFLGLFAQAEAAFDRPLGIPGELLVVPGIRFDNYKSSSSVDPEENDDEAVSPRIAASYGPVEWLRVFGGYSEGFRAPSIDELYLDGVHFQLPHPILGAPVFISNQFIPNPDLVPEKTETVEFGAGLDFRDVAAPGDRFQAKVSRFETDATDLINLAVDFAFPPTCFAPPFQPCNAGVTISDNVDAAELWGWEAEARYDTDRISLSAAFSTVDGENSATGNKLGVLTPATLTLDGSYLFEALALRLGARVQAADEFDKVNDPSEIRPGYVVGDLYASWAPEALGGVRIDAGVDNVLDHDYDRVFAGVSEPGRNARIAFTYTKGF